LWFSNRTNQTKALEIGFHKIGIVRAESLRKGRRAFQTMARNNFHGEMQWLEREPEKRFDPNLIFPEAKSIVVVALNYYTPHEHEAGRSKRQSFALRVGRRLSRRFKGKTARTFRIL
jgi:epoxyqueuosine reductase